MALRRVRGYDLSLGVRAPALPAEHALPLLAEVRADGIVVRQGFRDLVRGHGVVHPAGGGEQVRPRRPIGLERVDRRRVEAALAGHPRDRAHQVEGLFRLVSLFWWFHARHEAGKLEAAA